MGRLSGDATYSWDDILCYADIIEKTLESLRSQPGYTNADINWCTAVVAMFASRGASHAYNELRDRKDASLSIMQEKAEGFYKKANMLLLLAQDRQNAYRQLQTYYALSLLADNNRSPARACLRQVLRSSISYRHWSHFARAVLVLMFGIRGEHLARRLRGDKHAILSALVKNLPT